MKPIGFLSNNIQSKKKEKFIKLATDYTHAMILGVTGSGKTSSAILPILEDRISKNHGILIFDYKGEEHKKVKYLAKKYNRLKDVVMLNIPWGRTLNIIDECNTKIFLSLIEDKYLSSKGNDFWSKYAIGYVNSVLDILISREKLIKTLVGQGMLDFKPCEITMKQVTNYLSSEDDYRNFCLEIKRFRDIMDKYDFKSYVKRFRNREKIINFLVNIKYPLESFLNNSKLFLEQNKTFLNDSFLQSDEKTMFKRNLPGIISVLNKYANNEYLNKLDEKTLFDMLNDGNIVVLNTENLDDTILSVLLSGVLENSTKRKVFGKLNPISLFIDEAQKVLSPDTELYADVLREAKVEITLSFQNEHLLIEKIGDVKYTALKQNLVYKFIFKSEIQDYCQEAKDFDTFECFDGKDIFKAKPIFINDDELNLAEYEYQKLNEVIKNFAANIHSSNKYLIYNQSLFEKDNKFAVFDLKQKNIIDHTCFISRDDYSDIERFCWKW